ncbi:MAG: 1-acyl-sn-glycerol-3-phosphate acyltransferase [Anaerolineales bacterium]|nr:1-acyl-sn-glycerol-3-phosphate acyltransferase [Anaerolineales bacterium]
MNNMPLLSLKNPLDHPAAHYVHSEFAARRRLCRFLLRTIGFTVLVNLDRVEGLENIPAEGPAILMMNHIGFVDPIILVHVAPREIVPLAKVEAYDYPVVGIFPRLWGVIPVQRDGVDRHAVQMALEVLRAGEILLVAPEGTRGPALQPPREGAVYLASRSGAPIIPVAVENSDGFPTHPFSRRWREPGAKITIGRPFRVRPAYRRARSEQLTQLAEEAMYVIAEMLPSERRGVYADLSKATQEMIEKL